MKLVVVTGPDGVGKTTLCEAAMAAWNGRHGPGTATTAQIWDVLGTLVTKEVAQQYLQAIGPRSRSLLLLHAVSRAVDLAEAHRAKILLFDGYWYKYAVSELEFGAPAALFERCNAFLPRPDLTVHLDLPVERALARKRSFTAYEQGHAGGADAFVTFQTRLRARWRALEATEGPWVHLDAEKPVDDLVAELLARSGP